MPFIRLYTPVFMATLLLSAFLLFSVEPMAGKMILPLLGGTPQVWNTAMVFFQTMLLVGYAYAHLSARCLNVPTQAAVHVILLAACIFVLPVAIPSNWPAPDTGHPIGWQFHLMLAMAGAPFFLIAATAPLVQHWYAHSGHPGAGNPYFLYAASNAGSLAALLLYPTVIEPALSIGEQSRVWQFGFIVLVTFIGLSGILAGYRKADGAKPVPCPAAEPLGWATRIKWLLLALAPSSLMLGVTTFITTDIAAVPLLWVIPLALYVLTFIVAFAGQTAVTLRVATIMQTLCLLFLLFIVSQHLTMTSFIVIPLHLALFFFTALLCHAELANIKPGTSRLTEFYLIISLGGVLGGMFNALAAPVLFVLPVEYALVLGLSCFARYMHRPDQRFTMKYVADSLLKWFAPLAVVIVAAFLTMFYAGFKNHVPELGAAAATIGMLAIMRNRLAFAIGAVVMLALNPGFPWALMQNVKMIERNFFGVAKVQESAYGQMRLFFEGTTVHGAQPLVSPYQLVPVGYYHPQGPVGNVFGILDQRGGQQKVAALGLGVGSIACYTRPGRLFDFYEIDPVVPKIAQDPKLFTYLSQCGSPYKIIMGDARLQLRGAPDHSYDLIFLDAFSSDNIPIHLLTQEAFTLYRQKLKPHGLIVADISNRYMDLIPVMQAAADTTGMHAYFKDSGVIKIKEPDVIAYASIYAVFTTAKGDANPFIDSGWGIYQGKDIRAWTDDYANPIASMWFMNSRRVKKD